MSVSTYQVQWKPFELSQLDDDEIEAVEKYVNAQSKKERREAKATAESMLAWTRFDDHEEIKAGKLLTPNWTGSVLMYGFKSNRMGNGDYEPLPPRNKASIR